MTYRLTRRCEQDIIGIHRRGSRLFGLAHADRYQDGLEAIFELLSAYPKIAPERSFSKRGLRLHPYKAHLIIYSESEGGILIIRVLHARQDWKRHLRG